MSSPDQKTHGSWRSNKNAVGGALPDKDENGQIVAEL